MPKGIRTKELDLREFCVRVRTHLGRDVLINTVRGLQQLLGVASHCQCAENAKKIGSCGGGQPPAAPATGRWETPPDPSSSPRQLQAHDSAARDAQMQPIQRLQASVGHAWYGTRMRQTGGYASSPPAHVQPRQSRAEGPGRPLVAVRLAGVLGDVLDHIGESGSGVSLQVLQRAVGRLQGRQERAQAARKRTAAEAEAVTAARPPNHLPRNRRACHRRPELGGRRVLRGRGFAGGCAVSFIDGIGGRRGAGQFLGSSLQPREGSATVRRAACAHRAERRGPRTSGTRRLFAPVGPIARTPRFCNFHNLVGKELAPRARRFARPWIPVAPSRIAAGRFALPASRVLSLGNALRGAALAFLLCRVESGMMVGPAEARDSSGPQVPLVTG